MSVADDTDFDEPGSDSWWLRRLYEQLRVQQRACKALRARYEGDAPIPFVTDIQKDAVRWFVEKSRTNYERVIVEAVLSRLRIRGIRTAAGDDDHGDPKGFKTWRKARGKLFTLDAHEMALTMAQAYVIVGRDPDTEQLLVTAEDPRLVTAICAPSDPYRALAALKLFYDEVAQADVAYLYLPGRIRVATKPRKRAPGSADVRFNPRAFDWDDNIYSDVGDLIYEGKSGDLPWLQENGPLPAAVPVVPLFNGKTIDDAVAYFEPFIPHLDRLNQQMLQRMTIATIQAFRQRAFKGLPSKDPDTGEKIDYNNIFTADPGAVWHIPAAAEVWESGQVDITPLVNSYRDDVKDLFAISGTPGYLASPDAANASAEAASLQREMTTFAVEKLHDRFELSHELICEMMFRTLGDAERSQPGTVEVIWVPAERLSVAERANAIAQTKGVIPRYQQLTEVWGMDPAMADRAMGELTLDAQFDQLYASGLKADQGSVTNVTNNDS